VGACYSAGCLLASDTLERWRPRAYGRATKILKRTSHITLVVSSLGEDA